MEIVPELEQVFSDSLIDKVSSEGLFLRKLSREARLTMGTM